MILGGSTLVVPPFVEVSQSVIILIFSDIDIVKAPVFPVSKEQDIQFDIPVRRKRRHEGPDITEPSANPRKPVAGLEAIMSSGHHAIHSSTGIRISVPLPESILQESGLTQSKEKPTLLLDTEWFFLDSYPKEIRPYILSFGNFDTRPSTSEEILKLTSNFLMEAYTLRNNIGLNVNPPKILDKPFGVLVEETGTGYVHKYGESEEINGVFISLAYVFSLMLLNAGATLPLRSYTEISYPGIIVASYVNRMTGYYNAITSSSDLLKGKHFLTHGVQQKSFSITHIPFYTNKLRITAEYITGRKILTSCDEELYEVLQESILNVKDLPRILSQKIASTHYDQGNPNHMNELCRFYLERTKAPVPAPQYLQ
jgi:hypothetical protein